VAPSFLRDSGLIDWRAVLARCTEQIGRGNLLRRSRKVSAWPNASVTKPQPLGSVDRVAHTVMEQVRAPGLSFSETAANWTRDARSFGAGQRLLMMFLPILSRFGVSAFTSLSSRRPEYFGWGCTSSSPGTGEEHGNERPARPRLLRSAYAFALYRKWALVPLLGQEDQVRWQCSLNQFSGVVGELECHPDFIRMILLYGMASRHGVTPLAQSASTHTARDLLLAGPEYAPNLPGFEVLELCLRTGSGASRAGELESGGPSDLARSPLRLRKAVLNSFSAMAIFTNEDPSRSRF